MSSIRPLLMACVVALVLAACSSFNMSPHCEETAPGLQRLIAIAQDSGPPDYARLARIVHVTAMHETGSSYNARTCSAQVEVGRQTATLAYSVRQSEGLQNWYGIEFLQPDDAKFASISAEARSAYASGL